MRLLIKLILLAVIAYVLYHFFGPQIDGYIHQAKTTITTMFDRGDHGKNDSSDQDRKYYPVEKRAQ